MESNQSTSAAPAPSPQQAPVPPKASQGLAIAALVVGIVAFLSGWAPVVGMIVGAVGIVLGIVALTKKQSKGMSVTGIVLASLAVLFSLLATLFWGAIFGGAAQVANQVSQEQQAVDNAKKDFAKNETAVFGNLTVKVNTFTQPWQPTDGFSVPKDGYEFVYVSLNIKNTSNEDEDVNPFDFKLNDNGVVADHEIASSPTPLNAIQLKPGSAVDGDLVFQAKKGATNLKLQYETYNSKALKQVTYTITLN